MLTILQHLVWDLALRRTLLRKMTFGILAGILGFAGIVSLIPESSPLSLPGWNFAVMQTTTLMLGMMYNGNVEDVFSKTVISSAALLVVYSFLVIQASAKVATEEAARRV